MGSWDVYCDASKLCIGVGTKAVLLPIRRQIEPGTFSEWVPSTLPIFGTYDDYGRLADIEENTHTKLIEEHFGKTIYEFQEGLERADFESGKGIENWNYMWFRRDVWDYLKDQNLDNDYEKDCLRGCFLGEEFILKSLGLVLQSEKSGEERYTQKWIHPNGTMVHSDGTWCHGVNEQGIYRWQDFVDTGIPVLPEIRKKPFYEFWWEFPKSKEPKDEIEKLFTRGPVGVRKKTSSIMAWDMRTIDNIGSFDYSNLLKRARKEKNTDDLYIKHLEWQLKNTTGILPKYMKLVNDNKGMAILSTELSNFIHNCFLTYTIIRPTSRHSPQWGEYEASQKFATLVKQLADKDVLKYKQEEE